jgi:hypothetical protein
MQILAAFEIVKSNNYTIFSSEVYDLQFFRISLL